MSETTFTKRAAAAELKPEVGCLVYSPTVVHVYPEDKDEFDMLAVPETVNDWRPCITTTLRKKDGQLWEKRCRSKTVIGSEYPKVEVYFWWYEYRPIVTTAVPGGPGQ